MNRWWLKMCMATMLLCMTAIRGTAQSDADTLNVHLQALVADCEQRYQQLSMQGSDTTGIRAFQSLLEEYYQALRDPATRAAAEDGIDPWWPLLSLGITYNTLQNSKIDGLCRFVRSYYATKEKGMYLLYITFLEQYYMYNMSRRYLSYALETAEEMIQVAKEAADTTLVTAVGYYYAACVYSQLPSEAEMDSCLYQVYAIGKDRVEQEQNNYVYYNYASGLAMLANVYASKGKNQQALDLVEEICEGVRSRFSEVSMQYISALMTKADLLSKCGKPAEALVLIDDIEALGQQLPPEFQLFWHNTSSQLNMARQALGDSSRATADISDMSDAELLMEMNNAVRNGDMERSIAAGRLWMERCEQYPQPNFAMYSQLLRVMAGNYTSRSNYHDALAMLQRAEQFFIERNTADPLAVRIVYALYGDIYHAIADPQRAIENYNRSKLMYEEAGDLSGPYRMVVLNMFYAYVSCNDHAYARLFGEEIIEMLNQLQPMASDDQLGELDAYRHSIFTFLQTMGYDEPTAQRMAGVDSSSELDESSPFYVLGLINHALVQFGQRNLPEVKRLLEQLQQSEYFSMLNEGTRNQIAMMRMVCDLAEGNAKAIGQMKEINTAARQNTFNIFSTFSEAERDAFWEQQAMMLNSGNGTLAHHFQDYPETALMAYDNALFVKNLLNTSASLMRRLVKQSGDQTLQNRYQMLVSLKERIIRRNTPADSIGDYRQQVTQAERSIIRQLGSQSQLLEQQFLRCTDVRSMLGTNDVAIEFIQFSTFGDELEDNNVYAALVLRHDDAFPHYVALCKQEDIDGIWQDVIHTDTALINRQYSIADTDLYDKVWRPLSNLLKEGDHVWFSLTGVLNRINFYALSNGQKRLADVYDLHQVSSTANITQMRSQSSQKYQSAIVYGGIEYEASDREMMEAAAPYGRLANRDDDSRLMATRSVRSNRGAIEELPGTLIEAESIVDVLRSQQVEAQLLEGSRANEESFKAMDGRSPQIIHIGTHGFMLSTYDDLRQHQSFLESLNNNSTKASVMEMSGLLMAGAYHVWLEGGSAPEGVEDGILTSAEISRLDLSNTQLMVLSACETGLALSTTADDLGLRRALKNAGVETLVMSLWEVPDDATTLLMTNFFNNLTQGMQRHRALLDAQEKVRQQFPQPFCWAGFVILD